MAASAQHIDPLQQISSARNLIVLTVDTDYSSKNIIAIQPRLTGGDIEVITHAGDQVIIRGVDYRELIGLRIQRVVSDNTTATGIVAYIV